MIGLFEVTPEKAIDMIRGYVTSEALNDPEWIRVMEMSETAILKNQFLEIEIAKLKAECYSKNETIANQHCTILTLQKERDAAERYKTALIEDMPQLKACVTCKHWKQITIREKTYWHCAHDDGIDKKTDIGWCDSGDHWEWRGPREVQG